MKNLLESHYIAHSKYGRCYSCIFQVLRILNSLSCLFVSKFPMPPHFFHDNQKFHNNIYWKLLYFTLWNPTKNMTELGKLLLNRKVLSSIPISELIPPILEPFMFSYFSSLTCQLVFFMFMLSRPFWDCLQQQNHSVLSCCHSIEQRSWRNWTILRRR